MKGFFFDENLPESLLPVPATLGHDTDNVRGEHLTGQADPDICNGKPVIRGFPRRGGASRPGTCSAGFQP